LSPLLSGRDALLPSNAPAPPTLTMWPSRISVGFIAELGRSTRSPSCCTMNTAPGCLISPRKLRVVTTKTNLSLLSRAPFQSSRARAIDAVPTAHRTANPANILLLFVFTVSPFHACAGRLQFDYLLSPSLVGSRARFVSPRPRRRTLPHLLPRPLYMKYSFCRLVIAEIMLHLCPHDIHPADRSVIGGVTLLPRMSR
jgi:hypothetical protein